MSQATALSEGGRRIAIGERNLPGRTGSAVQDWRACECIAKNHRGSPGGCTYKIFGVFPARGEVSSSEAPLLDAIFDHPAQKKIRKRFCCFRRDRGIRADLVELDRKTQSDCKFDFEGSKKFLPDCCGTVDPPGDDYFSAHPPGDPGGAITFLSTPPGGPLVAFGSN